MTKILIVDDHPTNREFLAKLLAYKGYQICEASDGAEALATVAREQPELIVTDILMPTMDGYEFVRQLRLDPAVAHTAIVFCTADYREREAQRLAESCGVTNVLIKPCEPETVLRTVESALGMLTETPKPAPPVEFDREHLRLLTDKLSQKTATLELVNRRLAALIDASLQLAAQSDPSCLLESACRAARELIGAKFSAVAASTTATDTPEHFFTSGIDANAGRNIINPAWRRGVLGALLIQRRPNRFSRIDESMESIGLPAGFPPIRHLLAAPVDSLQQTYGWICLGDKLGDEPFSQDDERLLTILGEQAGRMYENITLYAKAQRDAVALQREANERRQAQNKLQAQLGRLALLHQITRAIGERHDLRSIFQVVIRSLEDNLPIDFCCVYLYEPEQRALTAASTSSRIRALNLQLVKPEPAAIAVDANGLARCIAGEVIYEPNMEQVQYPLAQRLAKHGLRSMVAAPLLVENRVFGVLLAARRQSLSFSSSECEFLLQLSEHVALAAHQAQLYGALQQAYDDLRQSQQSGMQQERLRALGQMASGVAHDINNAISPIALYTESLLEQEKDLSARARAYLGTIQRAIEGVAQTVRRMHEFSRPREPRLAAQPINLNEVVEQAIQLTRARWSDLPQERGIVISLSTELQTSLPDIAGMPNELNDAVTNLIFNAVDAMPQGGALILRTRSVAADSPSESSVFLEVSDSGIGMDEQTRRRCLEPFFTTKGEQGTGLGLAMVYGMVQRHSAELHIDSAVGQGTTLTLKFPQALTAPGFANWQPIQIPQRPLSILLVDDDPLIIQSLRDTLVNDGHSITTSDGGRAGIAEFIASTERNQRFELVITDLGMPYVDGRTVAARVKARSPQTPVIMLTGWGHRLTADNESTPQVDRILSKPPKLTELRRAIAELTA